MQKINLRDLYPDVYKTDVFVEVAEEILAVIRNSRLNIPVLNGRHSGQRVPQ